MEGDDDAADGDVVVGRAMTWVRSCLRRVQVGVCIDWGARGKELSDKDGVARVFMRQSGGLGNYSLACHLTCGSPGVNSHRTGRNIISVIVAHSHSDRRRWGTWKLAGSGQRAAGSLQRMHDM
jgi:hypothetical protein